MCKLCHIDPLKGNHIGAKVSSVEALFQEHIQDYLNQNPPFNTNDDKLQINMSGDGARMTRNSNFILLSFSILQTGESVMSAKRNRTIAIVNGSKGYQTLQEAFREMFSVSISHVIKTKNRNRSINKFKNLGYDR